MTLTSMLNQTCYIARYTGYDSVVGDELHGEPVSAKCRIDYASKLVYSHDGTSRPSMATVYLDMDITDHDWIYLDAQQITTVVSPAEQYNTSEYNVPGDPQTVTTLEYGVGRKPLQVNHLYDGSGKFHHCEVVL